MGTESWTKNTEPKASLEQLRIWTAYKQEACISFHSINTGTHHKEQNPSVLAWVYGKRVSLLQLVEMSTGLVFLENYMDTSKKSSK